VASPWSDLDRPPLSGRALTAALVRDGDLWREIRVVGETGSTNDDLAAAARGGAVDGSVLVAEAQSAGRGRLDRSWVSPPRAGLTFSVLLRPGPAVPPARWSWLPLLAGLAVQRAVGRLAEIEAWLKWPNDLLLGPHRRKAAGLLAQVVGDAVVLGVGLNVTTQRAELPRPDSTSLLLEEAACTDRDPLIRGILRQLAADYRLWRAAGGDPAASGLRAGYTAGCDTFGRAVRAALPDGGAVEGVATGLDEVGRLVLRADGGNRVLSAADVTHLRPAAAPGPDRPAPDPPAADRPADDRPVADRPADGAPQSG
jgi:BirA family transcriptional regulator, biotin operon repressor / biotin---[acetyl-CoA-carboxylase] ligase